MPLRVSNRIASIDSADVTGTPIVDRKSDLSELDKSYPDLRWSKPGKKLGHSSYYGRLYESPEVRSEDNAGNMFTLTLEVLNTKSKGLWQHNENGESLEKYPFAIFSGGPSPISLSSSGRPDSLLEPKTITERVAGYWRNLRERVQGEDLGERVQGEEDTYIDDPFSYLSYGLVDICLNAAEWKSLEAYFAKRIDGERPWVVLEFDVVKKAELSKLDTQTYDRNVAVVHYSYLLQNNTNAVTPSTVDDPQYMITGSTHHKVLNSISTVNEPICEALNKTLDITAAVNDSGKDAAKRTKEIICGITSIDYLLCFDVGQANLIGLADASAEVKLFCDLGFPCTSQMKTCDPEPMLFLKDKEKSTVILTHWHKDHYSAAELYPECYCWNWIVNTSNISIDSRPEIYQNIRHKGCIYDLKGCDGGQVSIQLDDGKQKITIICCTGTDINNSGLAVVVSESKSTGGTGDVKRWLIPGDADYKHIPNAHKIRPQVLVASHHGGKVRGIRGSYPERPDYSYARILFSMGHGNKYHHPSAEAIDRYTNARWKIGRDFPIKAQQSGDALATTVNDPPAKPHASRASEQHYILAAGWEPLSEEDVHTIQGRYRNSNVLT